MTAAGPLPFPPLCSAVTLCPMWTALSLAIIGVAWALRLMDVEPVPTWFYVIVWYPTLVLLDRLAHRLDGRTPLIADPRRAASLFLWSAPIWLLFEAANFRLDNWYYVFLPRALVERWAGILLSFATVVPAIVLAERALDAARVGHGWRSAPLRVRPWELRAAVGVGVAAAVAALLWPERCFPLVWGAIWLITDPFVYRHRPEWSLLGDAARGEWGRIGRLMMGGLGIGALWEGYNHLARGQWIYTVPWLEQLKVFEMPPLGFLGFPFFALEAWALYHVLCVQGVAAPVAASEGERASGRAARRITRIGAGVAAAVFAVLVLAGMERWTISSMTPRLVELPGISAPLADELRAAGVSSPFALAAADPDVVARRTGGPRAPIADAVDAARLVTLRGIGTVHGEVLWRIGVRSVCTLASALPERLWVVVHLHAPGRARPTPAEVREWVDAALHACPEP